MVAYHYDFRIALVKGSPNTVAANATVLVYDPLDTGMTTPVAVYSNPGMTTIINLVTDAHGVVPDFWSERPDLLWKSGTYSGGWATTSSRPGLRGPSGGAGPTGPTGPQGAPGLNGAGTNADIAAFIPVSGPVRDALDDRYTPTNAMPAFIEVNLPTRLSEDALNVNFVREDATALQTRGMFVTSDSFGTVLNGITPYPARIDSDRDMSLVSTAVGGQFFQDGFSRNWGTAATASPGSPADAFCLVAFGINPAHHRGNSAPSRVAEKNSLEALIWLLAAGSIGADTDWTLTGTWSTYSGGGSENMRGGSAKLTDAVGAYATITPTAGDYVAIGHSFSAGLGIRSELGQYSKNGVPVGTTYVNDLTTGAPVTPNGSNVIPKAQPLIGLTGADEIKVERTLTSGGDYMFVDSLIKLSTTPPWIIIVKPTYATADTWFPTADANVDAYRADIDSVIASVTATYPPLRGKIIVVDPVTSGWDREAHTDTDGLHPNSAGHEFLSWLVQRQVAYAVRLRQQLLTTGQLTA